MNDKLQKLYNLYKDNGLITIDFNTFASANDNQRKRLYDLGIQKGLFSTTPYDTFDSAFSGIQPQQQPAQEDQGLVGNIKSKFLNQQPQQQPQRELPRMPKPGELANIGKEDENATFDSQGNYNPINALPESVRVGAKERMAENKVREEAKKKEVDKLASQSDLSARQDLVESTARQQQEASSSVSQRYEAAAEKFPILRNELLKDVYQQLQKEQDLPDFVKNQLNQITPDLINLGEYGPGMSSGLAMLAMASPLAVASGAMSQNVAGLSVEEAVVPKMNYMFGPLGFKFEESGMTGDYMVVTAPNSKDKIEISLNNFTQSSNAEEAKKLKNFIAANSTKIPNIENVAGEYVNKVSSQADIDHYTKTISKDYESLNKDATVLANDIKSFETNLNELNSTPMELRSTPEYLEKKKSTEAALLDINTRRQQIIDRNLNIEAQAANLDKSVGKYAQMKSEQGTWTGATFSWLGEGVSSILAGGANLFIDLASIDYSGQASRQIQSDIKKSISEQQATGDAAEDSKNGGVAVDAAVRLNNYLEKKGSYDAPIPLPKKGQTYKDWYNSLSSEDQSRLSSKIDDDIIKRAKQVTLPAIRNTIEGALGDPNTTVEWKNLAEENFWGGAYAGLIKSAPAMVTPGGWAARTAAFFAQSTDAVTKEMDNNPDFADVPESEKLLVTIPIGVANAVLEEVGLSNMIKNKGFVNNLLVGAMRKAGVNATETTLSKIIKNDVESMLARGVLTLAGGGLAEAETGALQQVAEYAVKDIYNMAKNKQMFDTPDSLNEYVYEVAKAGAQEAVGGMIMSVPSASAAAYRKRGFKGMSDDEFRTFEAIANDENMQSSFVANLKTKVATRAMTMEAAKEELNDYRNAVGLYRSVDTDLTIEAKKEAMNLIREKQSLIQQIEGKDEAIVSRQKKRIAEINVQLNNLSENAVQEQTTSEVPIQSETAVSEEVAGGKPTAESQVTTEEGKEQEVNRINPETGVLEVGLANPPIVTIERETATTLTQEEQDRKTELETAIAKESGKGTVTIGDALVPIEEAQAELDALNSKTEVETRESIEAQRQAELEIFKDNLDDAFRPGSDETVEEYINRKYDEYINRKFGEKPTAEATATEEVTPTAETKSVDLSIAEGAVERTTKILEGDGADIAAIDADQELDAAFEAYNELLKTDDGTLKGAAKAKLTKAERKFRKLAEAKGVKDYELIAYKRAKKELAAQTAVEVAPVVEAAPVAEVTPAEEAPKRMTREEIRAKEKEVAEENKKAKENRGQNINVRDYKRTKKRGQDLKIGDVYVRRIGDTLVVFKVLSKLTKNTGQFYYMDVEVLHVGNYVNRKEVGPDGEVREGRLIVGRKTVDSFKNMSSGTGKFNFGEVTVLENFEAAPEAKTEAAPEAAPAVKEEPVAEAAPAPKTEPAPAPAKEVKVDKQWDEEMQSVSMEIDYHQDKIEQLKEEIEIEKGNTKEGIAEIKEKMAKVRESVTNKETRRNLLEELETELEDFKESQADLIQQYKDDIVQEKADIKKAQKRLDKLIAKKEQATQPEAAPKKRNKILKPELNKRYPLVVEFLKSMGYDVDEITSTDSLNILSAAYGSLSRSKVGAEKLLLQITEIENLVEELDQGVKKVSKEEFKKQIAESGDFDKKQLKIFNALIDSLQTELMPEYISEKQAKNLGGGENFYINSLNQIISKDPQAFIHEVGHFAFYKILSKEDRLNYYRYMIDSNYGKGKPSLASRMAISSDQLLGITPEGQKYYATSNATDNFSEYFAVQFEQWYMNERLFPKEIDTIFSKVADFFNLLIEKLKSGEYVDKNLSEYFNKISVKTKNQQKKNEKIQEALGIEETMMNELQDLEDFFGIDPEISPMSMRYDTPLQKMALMYNMTETGFFPRNASEPHINRDFFQFGLKAKRASSGSYYLVDIKTGRMVKPLQKPKGGISPQLSRMSVSTMPMSAENVLYADSEVLPKPTKKIPNAQVARMLQEIAANFWGGSIIKSDSITPEQEEVITNNGIREAIKAFLDSGKNAADWYSKAIEVAIAVAAVIHPEINSNQEAIKIDAFSKEKNPSAAAQMILRMALAITSQNLDVSANTKYGEEQYEYFKKNGKFDPSREYGAKALAISSNLKLANLLIEKLGINGAEEFISREFVVQDLEQAFELATGNKLSISELRNDTINGARIFGPKIGQGFLQNLMGKFDPVTIDLWMRRTWGRWTGDVVGSGITEERMAKLYLSVRDAIKNKEISIKLPKEFSENKPIKEKRKSGGEFWTMSTKFSDRIATDSNFTNTIQGVAKELALIANSLYKVIHDIPMSEDLYKKFLSGEMSYVKVAEKSKAIRNKLSENYSKYVSLEKSKNRTPLKKADWINQQDKAQGRTYSPTNNEISERKPQWAKDAVVIIADLNPIDVPSNSDRRVITRVVNNIRKGMQAQGYNVTNADVQALLWYPEKDIWAKLRGEEESQDKLSYDNEFIKLATKKGLGEQAEQVAEKIRSRGPELDSSESKPGTDGEVSELSPEQEGLKTTIPNQVSPMSIKTMDMEDVIDTARENGFSDDTIKALLIKRGYDPKEVDSALTFNVNFASAYTNNNPTKDSPLPQAFRTIDGGVSDGIKLFFDVRNKLIDFAQTTKKKGEKAGKRVRTYAEIRAKAIELLEANPIFQAQTDTKQKELIAAFDKTLNIKRGKLVSAQIAEIRKALKERLVGMKDLKKAQLILRNFIRQSLPAVKVPRVFFTLDGLMSPAEGINYYNNLRKQVYDFARTGADGKMGKKILKTSDEIRTFAMNLIKGTELYKKQTPDVQSDMVNGFINSEYTKGPNNTLDIYSQKEVNKLIDIVSQTDAKNFLAQAEKVFDIITEQRNKIKAGLLKEMMTLVNKKAKAAITTTGKRRANGLDAQGQSFYQAIKPIIKAAITNDTDAMIQIATELSDTDAIDNALAKEAAGEKLTTKEQALLDKVLAFDTFGDILNMELEEVQDLLDGLKGVRSESIVRLNEKRAERAAQREAMTEEADNQIRDGYEMLFNADGTPKDRNQLNQDKAAIWQAFKDRKVWSSLKQWLDRYDFVTSPISDYFRKKLAHLGTISNILDKTGTFFTDNLYRALNRMDESNKTGYLNEMNGLDDMANSINGVTKGYKQIRRMIESVGVVKMVIDGKDVIYNGDQLLRIYALSLNEVQRNKLKNMGFTEDKINDIKKKLGPETIEFADKLVEYFSNEYFESINDIYALVNDVNLGYVENYFPTQTLAPKVDGKLLEDGDFNGIFNAESSPAFKERTDMSSPVDLSASFTNVVESHFQAMERYKAYAVGVKRLNDLFKIPSVNVLLEETGLKSITKNLVNMSVNPNAGVKQTQTKLSAAMNKFSGYALAFKLAQIPKQATAIAAAYEDYQFLKGRKMPVLDTAMFIIDVAKALTLARSNFNKFYNLSGNFRDRVNKGVEGDVYGLESGGKIFKPLSQKATRLADVKRFIKSAAASPTMVGDIISVYGYMANYNRDIANGMSPEAALEKFNNYNATLQSRRATDKSTLQFSQNELTRAFTMFGSTGLLQINKVAMAYKNIMRSIANGKVPSGKDTRAFALNLGVANALFVGASYIFALIKGDDEDKEKVKDKMFEALVGLNLLYQIPLIGGAAEEVANAIKGEKTMGGDVTNPYTSVFRKIKKQYDEDNNVIQNFRPVAEFALGMQFDPFIGLYEGVTDEFNDDIMYDILGISPSYRPKNASSLENMNKTELKKYKPEEYERLYGPGSEDYDEEQAKKEAKAAERKARKDAMDDYYNYESKDDNKRGGSRIGGRGGSRTGGSRTK